MEALAEISARFGVHTLVVVLMDNHYHLVVEDEGHALSSAIGHLNQLHAQRFNGRRGRVGALFQGRFKSRLVQEEVYLAELVRYVHANPVKAGMVARAGDYAWSSHHVYLSGATPEWLHKSKVMRLFGDDTPEGRRTLDAFVHARVPEAIQKVLDWRRSPAIVGDEAFKAAHRENARKLRASGRDDVRGERPWLNLQVSEVIEAVASHCGVDLETIRQAVRGRLNRPRRATLILCVELTAASGREIAAAM